jgi:hypothetical protein
MTKKDFKSLKKTSNSISKGGLASFLDEKDSEDKTFHNPLRDKRKPPKKDDSDKKETPSEIQEEPKPAKPESKPKVERELADQEKNISPGPQVKHQRVSFNPESIPDDFKSHSALFSADQLERLRRLVNYKKWKVNPKYTIQFAIYEAIEMLFNGRIEITNFPDDFETYSPSFSADQLERLKDFVYEVRFKSSSKYALKYAIFEAIELFLEDNPIPE